MAGFGVGGSCHCGHNIVFYAKGVRILLRVMWVLYVIGLSWRVRRLFSLVCVWESRGFLGLGRPSRRWFDAISPIPGKMNISQFGPGISWSSNRAII